MLDLNACYKICSQHEMFYATEVEVDNVPLVIFNYRLAWYKDFVNIPLSTELRGLTFNKETGERFWSIHKIFNVGEAEPLLPENLLKKSEEYIVEDKLDGSLIQVINVNNKIVPKTKATFDSPQARRAATFLDDNPNYKLFIQSCWEKGMQPIFELLSPNNQIVVYYPITTLLLTQIRTEEGRYLNLQEHNLHNFILSHDIDCVQVWNTKNLNNLLILKQKLVNCEGWILTNPNDFNEKYKLKTDWYLSLHRIVSEYKISVKAVIHSLLDETLDDAITVLQKSPKRTEVERIAEIVETWFNKTVVDIKNILATRPRFSTRKEFALAYKHLPYFGIAMEFYNDKKVIDERITSVLSASVKKQTRTETRACEFLERIQEKPA